MELKENQTVHPEPEWKGGHPRDDESVSECLIGSQGRCGARMSFRGSRRTSSNATSNCIRLAARDAPIGLAGRSIRPQGPRDLGTVAPPQGLRGNASEATDRGTRSIIAMGGGGSKMSNHFSRDSTGSLLPCCLWAELPVVLGWNRLEALGFACRDFKWTLPRDVNHSGYVPGRPVVGRRDPSSCNLRSIS
jgi:hypothetical protein